jgi:hemolysin III
VTALPVVWRLDIDTAATETVVESGIMSDSSTYSPTEEALNIGSHGLGLLLSLFACLLLVMQAYRYGDAWHITSAAIFGGSLITLYLASTLYHSARQPQIRARLRIADHAAIYVLIAGTYTPFALITLAGKTGWIFFAVTWSMAIGGIVLKLFFTGRFALFSTLLYVFMGWLIVFAINPLIDNLATAGLTWLVAGGIAYTVGAIIYAIHRVPFNHAIFHLFVLAGSSCHAISVYLYVLPQSTSIS